MTLEALQLLEVYFILPLLGVCFLLTFVRLLRGPSLADRVVALDLMTLLTIGIAAVYAITKQQTVYLDVATILALLSFLTTVAFAYYIEKRV